MRDVTRGRESDQCTIRVDDRPMQGPRGASLMEVLNCDETLALDGLPEIRVAGSDSVITMRTPGNDRELAAGLLASPGLVRSSRDLELLEPCPAQEHLILAQLSASTAREAGRLRRAGIVSSACAVRRPPSTQRGSGSGAAITERRGAQRQPAHEQDGDIGAESRPTPSFPGL